MFTLGSTIACRIEKSVYGGEGLARVDGCVVFVKDAFPGEVVEAKIVQVKKNFAKADVIKVVEPSAQYPRLAVEAAVPGMVYAAMSATAERELKRAQLEDFLVRANRAAKAAGVKGADLDEVAAIEVVAATQGLNYRNKVVYHCAGGKLGYRQEPSHEVLDVVSDPLALPAINAALPQIRQQALGADCGKRRQREDCNLTIRCTRLDGVMWWWNQAPHEVVRESTAGMVFEVPADGFYQVNPQMGEQLVAAVREAYLEAPGDLLDLYCGVGVFGLVSLQAAVARGSATGNFPRLVGVESGRNAVAAAKRNAVAAGLKANFFCERVGGALQRLRVSRGHTVVVDPPRGGLEANVAPWLAKCGAKRIFYVSCDPATLSRDLGGILAGYRIKRVRLFEMFPRTARFETLVELESRA